MDIIFSNKFYDESFKTLTIKMAAALVVKKIIDTILSIEENAFNNISVKDKLESHILYMFFIIEDRKIIYQNNEEYLLTDEINSFILNKVEEFLNSFQN